MTLNTKTRRQMPRTQGILHLALIAGLASSILLGQAYCCWLVNSLIAARAQTAEPQAGGRLAAASATASPARLTPDGEDRLNPWPRSGGFDQRH